MHNAGTDAHSRAVPCLEGVERTSAPRERNSVTTRRTRRRLKVNRFFRQTRPGEVPGVVVPDPMALKPRIRAFRYNADKVEERELASAAEIEAFRPKPGEGVCWIDITGLGDAETVQRVGQIFNLHRLELEDIVQPHQRAKVEEYGDHVYIVLREPVPVNGEITPGVPVRTHDLAWTGPDDGASSPPTPAASAPPATSSAHPHLEARRVAPPGVGGGTGPGGESVATILDSDQISMSLGHGWLITFQEKPGDCFEPVRERLRHRKGKLASLGSDTLAYALLDAVIDSYFPILENAGEVLENLEDRCAAQADQRVAHAIHEVKRDLLTIRRAIWPAREAISTLLRLESDLITHETKIYLRDCYDHLVQLIDMLENFREISSALMDIYLASISNRMNEIMKVLTMIATIFMPLSFIAGIYGMNFATRYDEHGSALNMPELHWRYGYLFALAIMGATAVGMLHFFRRKGWTGGNGGEPGRR